MSILKTASLAIVVFIIGCTYSVQPLPPLSDKFYDIQRRTFNNSCIGACHGGNINDASALLSLDSGVSYNQLLFDHKIQSDVAASQFKALVVPGDPDGSYLVFKMKLTQLDNTYGSPMPPLTSAPLRQNEIDAIISWIKRGAPRDSLK